MTQQKHIIKRQVIEVEVASHLNAPDVQDLVSQVFREKIIHVIDKLLTEKSLGGLNGKIDRLELDLGKVYLKNIEQSLIEKIGSALIKKLAAIKVIQPITNEQQASNTAENADLDLVIYFLKTGSFPWWAQNITYDILDKALEKVLAKNAVITRRSLVSLFSDQSILRRFVYTFSDKSLERFAELFLPAKSGLVINLQSQMLASFDGKINSSEFKDNWWFCLVKICANENGVRGNYDAATVIETFENTFKNKKISDKAMLLICGNPNVAGILNNLFGLKLRVIPSNDIETAEKHLAEITQSLSAIIDEESAGKRLSENLSDLKKYFEEFAEYFTSVKNGRWLGQKPVQEELDWLNDNLEKVKSSLKKMMYARSGKAEDISLEESLNDLNSHFENIQQTVGALKNKNLLERSPKVLDKRVISHDLIDKNEVDLFSRSDKIYIQNAGLVLLWPFLSRFFQNLGLLDDKAFIDESLAHKACLILQYITEGKSQDVFEAQLPLNKILCGVDLGETVNARWAISVEEAETCTDFINAVIGNGPMWKNLSVEGFRQAYLNREGALSTRDGNWLLQVKREAYDVIVDRLPWTIQVVKLPWMQNLIFVEWQQV